MNILRRVASEKKRIERDLESLSPRELEVLRLIARGINNRDIASTLFISERTVQAHIGNMLTKIGADSRTEAVLRAFKAGVITENDLP